MLENTSIHELMKSLVPISRFNKGEANKIFEEVKESGFKIVLKNNSPTCVLLTPEMYENMIETIEEYRLYMEAEKRIENSEKEDHISRDDVLAELGINETELKNTEAEIE